MNLNISRLDPVLHYKLDPGEWGSSAPSPASESIGRVAQHEAGNVLRFKKEATLNGCYIVGSSISLNISKSGQYLAASSGKSTVIEYCPKNKSADTLDNSDANKKLVVNTIDKQIQDLEQKKENSLDPAEKNQLDEEIKSLKAQKLIYKSILNYTRPSFSTSECYHFEIVV